MKLVNRHEIHDVSIARPSKWGNPFSSKPSKFPTYRTNSVIESIGCFARWAAYRWSPEDLAELSGRRAACFCKVGQPCHGQVLQALVQGHSIEKFMDYVSAERYAEILNGPFQ